MTTLTIIRTRIDSTTAAFTEFATPVGPPYGGHPLLARHHGDDGAEDHRLHQGDDHIAGGRERREGGDEAARRTVLEVDVEQIAREEADEADDAGECDADHDGGGEARHHQAPDHRDPHHLHRVGLFTHLARTEIRGDRRSDGSRHQDRGRQRRGLPDDREPAGRSRQRGGAHLPGQQGELNRQGDTDRQGHEDRRQHRGAGHERALADELLPLEATGEEVDEQVLNGANGEDELIADRRQRSQRMAANVSGAPVLDGFEAVVGIAGFRPAGRRSGQQPRTPCDKAISRRVAFACVESTPTPRSESVPAIQVGIFVSNLATARHAMAGDPPTSRYYGILVNLSALPRRLSIMPLVVRSAQRSFYEQPKGSGRGYNTFR